MTAPSVLADRTALVTGAGSGIGAAIAEELARAGAYVLVQDLRPDAAATVAEGIRAAGGAADAVGGDVEQPRRRRGNRRRLAGVARAGRRPRQQRRSPARRAARTVPAWSSGTACSACC